MECILVDVPWNVIYCTSSMECTLLYMFHGMYSIVHVLWYVLYCTCSMGCTLLYMFYGTYSIVHVLWNILYCTCSMGRTLLYMFYGIYSIVYILRNVLYCTWSMKCTLLYIFYGMYSTVHVLWNVIYCTCSVECTPLYMFYGMYSIVQVLWDVLYCTGSMGCTLLHIDRSEQERHNSIANALELRLSCTKPSTWFLPSLLTQLSLFVGGRWGQGCQRCVTADTDILIMLEVVGRPGNLSADLRIGVSRVKSDTDIARERSYMTWAQMTLHSTKQKK